MKATYEPIIQDLAVGLTKPPTKFGVPLVAFYLSIICCFFGWMFFQALSSSTGIFSILIFIFFWLIIYAYMAYMTFKDPFGLKVAWLNMTAFRKHRTYRFWGYTDSYAP